MYVGVYVYLPSVCGGGLCVYHSHKPLPHASCYPGLSTCPVVHYASFLLLKQANLARK